MSTKTTFFTFVLASLIATIVFAQGDKTPQFEGLAGLTSPYYQNTAYTLTQEGDQNGCDMNQCTAGGRTATVYRTAYADGSAVKICVCEGAAMDPNFISVGFGTVPQMIRQYTQFITVGSENPSGGAYSTGASSTYFQANMEVEVFIHESAHNFDFNKLGDGRTISGLPEWQTGINMDSCVPDGYAQTNAVEDFAQIIVLWMSLAAQNTWIDCMANQLGFIESFVPRDTLLSTMRPEFQAN